MPTSNSQSINSTDESNHSRQEWISPWTTALAFTCGIATFFWIMFALGIWLYSSYSLEEKDAAWFALLAAVFFVLAVLSTVAVFGFYVGSTRRRTRTSRYLLWLYVAIQLMINAFLLAGPLGGLIYFDWHISSDKIGILLIFLGLPNIPLLIIACRALLSIGRN